jgi:hypothetical protein
VARGVAVDSAGRETVERVLAARGCSECRIGAEESGVEGDDFVGRIEQQPAPTTGRRTG